MLIVLMMSFLFCNSLCAMELAEPDQIQEKCSIVKEWNEGDDLLAVMPDGDYLTSTPDKKKIWLMSERGPREELLAHAIPIYKVWVTSDGEKIVFNDGVLGVFFYDVKTKKRQSFNGKDFRAVAKLIQLIPNTHKLIIDHKRRLTALDLDAERVQKIIPRIDYCSTFAVSADGGLLAAAYINSDWVSIFSLKLDEKQMGVEMKKQWQLKAPFASPVSFLTFSPDNKKMIARKKGSPTLHYYDGSQEPSEVTTITIQNNRGNQCGVGLVDFFPGQDDKHIIFETCRHDNAHMPYPKYVGIADLASNKNTVVWPAKDSYVRGPHGNAYFIGKMAEKSVLCKLGLNK